MKQISEKRSFWLTGLPLGAIETYRQSTPEDTVSEVVSTVILAVRVLFRSWFFWLTIASWFVLEPLMWFATIQLRWFMANAINADNVRLITGSESLQAATYYISIVSRRFAELLPGLPGLLLFLMVLRRCFRQLPSEENHGRHKIPSAITAILLAMVLAISSLFAVDFLMSVVASFSGGGILELVHMSADERQIYILLLTTQLVTGIISIIIIRYVLVRLFGDFRSYGWKFLSAYIFAMLLCLTLVGYVCRSMDFNEFLAVIIALEFMMACSWLLSLRLSTMQKTKADMSEVFN